MKGPYDSPYSNRDAWTGRLSRKSLRALPTAQLQRIVDNFNATCPVGSPVVYKSHPDALATQTTITEAAFILGGHTACAFVKHVRGAVAVTALTRPSASETSHDH